AQVEVRPGQGRDAGAIVAAIFQPAQAFDQNRLSLAMPQVTDNAAHIVILPLAVAPRGLAHGAVSPNSNFYLEKRLPPTAVLDAARYGAWVNPCRIGRLTFARLL